MFHITPIRSDLRQDPFFVGRSQELQTIITNLLQNRHTLIIGDRGIGKTRLMHEVISLLTGVAHRIDIPHAQLSPDKYVTIFIDSPAPLSKFMKHLSSELMRHDQLKPVNAMKETELAEAILKAISNSGRKPILFIDNLDTVTASHRVLLEKLLEVATVCGGSQSVKQQPILKKIFDSFMIVAACPLATEESLQLIDYFVEHYKVRAPDRSLFRNQISKVSQGNPFQLKTFLHAAVTKGFHGQRRYTRTCIFSQRPRLLQSTVGRHAARSRNAGHGSAVRTGACGVLAVEDPVHRRLK